MAFYSKFAIKHFRGFQQEQNLLFGIPINEKSGSGITYLVGANNSGKTTVVEGLAMHKNNKIRSSEKQPSAAPEFVLFGVDGQIKRNAHLIRPESNTIIEDPELPDADIFEIISSRRHWGSQAGGNVDTISALAQTGKSYTRQDSRLDTSAIL